MVMQTLLEMAFFFGLNVSLLVFPICILQKVSKCSGVITLVSKKKKKTEQCKYVSCCFFVQQGIAWGVFMS